MDSGESRRREKNRIYLSAGQVSCAVPSVAHLKGTPTEIIIGVAGPRSSAPADSSSTTQKVSLVGYVQLNGPVGGRRMVGNTE
jgi:RecA/RadA recombinase